MRAALGQGFGWGLMLSAFFFAMASYNQVPWFFVIAIGGCVVIATVPFEAEP